MSRQTDTWTDRAAMLGAVQPPHPMARSRHIRSVLPRHNRLSDCHGWGIQGLLARIWPGMENPSPGRHGEASSGGVVTQGGRGCWEMGNWDVQKRVGRSPPGIRGFLTCLRARSRCRAGTQCVHGGVRGNGGRSVCNGGPGTSVRRGIHGGSETIGERVRLRRPGGVPPLL